ncbi:MAG: hypothetical protein EWM46_10810 [Fermentimonas caenicola]|nr:MAG: hypothetical protein EWM46_10810 [Fermentimonas caenicola]
MDENNIYSIIRRYIHHWMQRILSASISIHSSLSFVRQCFSSYQRQFMQIKQTPNILFFKPT